ncbi:MAG: serine/threonine protein kinase [Phycisphaerae bacterium]|jgi:serine/threonine protein kinase
MVGACLDAAQLDELAGGRVPAEQAGALRQHLDGCPDCRERLEECRRNLDYFNDVAEALRAQSLAGPRGPAGGSALAAGGPVASDARTDAERVPGYRIIREIHRGGQGVVYEAVQLSTRRTVALKMLLEGAYAGARARWRFEREVKLIAALRHPNIVVIHDSGITAGHYFFAMDYVRGQPLDTHVRLAAPPLREVVRLFRQICDAVAYAHRRGVIHRDLKPSNVLLNESGTPFVLDFGLAKITGEDIQESRAPAVSVAGHLMGTVRYMSPEQTLGVPEAVDVRTDVYSLGVMLYEVLTGTAPYATNADLAMTFRNIRDQDPPRPSRIRREINSDLETIILKAMAKEPERRYQSAGELAEDLGAWLDGRPIAAKSTSSLYVIRKLAIRHSFESLTLFALIAAMIGFGGVSFYYFRQARSDADALRDTRNALLAMNRSLIGERDEIRAALPRQALGWFLAEWEAGRLERARQVQGDVPPDAPEYAVMEFWLDDTADADGLRAKMGASHAALADFAVGVRAMRAGRTDEARHALRACLAGHGGDWLKSAAQARLAALAAGARPAEGRP